MVRAIYHHRGQLTSRFLPSSGMFYPTLWDWLTLIGVMGVFLTSIFIHPGAADDVNVRAALWARLTKPERRIETGERASAQPIKNFSDGPVD
jgi:hypothetical protein